MLFMVYAVYKIHGFKKEEEKLPKKDKNRIQKVFEQLKINPYAGDQLQIKSLREKRLSEKRIYYLVFEDLKAILIIGMSNKKTQQKTIDKILIFINDYRNYLKGLLEKDGN